MIQVWYVWVYKSESRNKTSHLKLDKQYVFFSGSIVCSEVAAKSLYFFKYSWYKVAEPAQTTFLSINVPSFQATLWLESSPLFRKGTKHIGSIYMMCTFWSFDIAMENGPNWFDDSPVHIVWWCSSSHISNDIPLIFPPSIPMVSLMYSQLDIPKIHASVHQNSRPEETLQHNHPMDVLCCIWALWRSSPN